MTERPPSLGAAFWSWYERDAGACAFVDPWGNTYMIAIDGNYDGLTTDYIPYTSGVTYGTGNTVSVGCFSLSYGKDGKQGKNGDKKYAGSDDVLSWQ